MHQVFYNVKWKINKLINGRIGVIWVGGTEDRKVAGRDGGDLRDLPGGIFPQGPAGNTKKTLFRSAKSKFSTARGFSMCLVCSWALEMESYPFLNSEPVLRGSSAKPMSQSPCLDARTPHPQGRAMWVWDHCGEGLVLGRGNLALGHRALMTDSLSQHPDAQGYER